MNDTIIIALLGLIGSGFGSVCGVIASSRLSNYKIQKLEEAVSKHNNLIDRMYKAERDIVVINQKLEDMEQ